MRCSIPLLVVVSALCAFGSVQASTPETYPLPRDASANDIVAGFSIDRTCHPGFLEEFKLTRDDCGAKVEKAKKDCVALIVEGLPELLEERQDYTLMGRSRVCLLSTIWERPFNREAADRASETMWKKHGNRD